MFTSSVGRELITGLGIDRWERHPPCTSERRSTAGVLVSETVTGNE